MSREALSIAIDIGATYTRVAVVDIKGYILYKIKYRTPSQDIAEKLRKILLEEFSSYFKLIDGIGIGSIGPLDIDHGYLVNPPNTREKNIDIITPIVGLGLNKPIILLNDASAAVWAEKIFGVGKNRNNIVYITISTGIGGGVIVDGRLLYGKDGNAHEIGHIPLNYDDDLPCPCGGIGHWEGYVSGRTITSFAKRVLKRYGYTSMSKEVPETPENLVDFLRRGLSTGNPLAIILLDELSKIYAAGIASVINLYDPEIITIGGGLGLRLFPIIKDSVLRYLDSYSINRLPEITITSLGEDIVLLGAAAAVFKRPSNRGVFI